MRAGLRTEQKMPELFIFKNKGPVLAYIDFETRSERDLKKVGIYKYSTDLSTEVLCAVIIIEDSTTILYPDTFRDYTPPLNAVWVSHNAEFEQNIWRNQMTPKYGWPEVSSWKCTAAKAAASGLPRSLDGAAKALGLIEQKDKAGHALMLKMCKPLPRWSRTGKGPKWRESTEDLKRLAEYCTQDVRTEKAIDEALPDLPPAEQKIWALDQLINQRGIHCDLQLTTACLEILDAEQITANARISEITSGEITSPNQVQKIAKWCGLPSIDKKTLEEELSEPSQNPHAELLRLRQANSKASGRKYVAIIDRADHTGRVRNNLIYHGAHTGRWSGAGVQAQNLIKPAYKREVIEDIGLPLLLNRDTESIKMLFGDVSTLVSSALRSTLCAEPGKVLIAADYSSIEARVLLWLAGETKALRLLSEGGDIYKDMAATIYDKKYEQVTKSERQLGKQAILGLGYGMGAFKFQKTCEGYGIEISPEFAQQVVTLYRQKYFRVVNRWHLMERLAVSAMAGPNHKFQKMGPMLQMSLRSGRKLSYFDPQVSGGSYTPVLTYLFRGNRIETYGGKLVENEVQATARDIMANGMLNVEERGYPIILTVHDEVVSEVPEGFGSVNEFCSLLCKRADWYKGCPISAEGWVGKRYRK
jgi:DNA polymerase